MIIAALALGAGAGALHPVYAVERDVVAYTTPPGITLQVIPGPQGTNPQAMLPGKKIFATAAGLSLYTNVEDAPGKSSCVDACASLWPPAAAPANAVTFGPWSVITRDDGTKQWALAGKPLYTFKQDAIPGDIKGGGVTTATPWRQAYLTAEKGEHVPYGVKAIDHAPTGGIVYANAAGQPLYTFSGDAEKDSTACVRATCTNRFVPLAAGQVERAIGNFSVVARDDGLSQWAYKGNPLYTFDGDTTPNDALGNFFDPRWHVVQLARHFMPDNVVIRYNHFRGYNLATAEGMTIYQIDRLRVNNGGHVLNIGSRGVPSVGRAIGPAGCDAACAKTWRPVKAPDGAQPNGLWEIVTRADGTKQWAYQGYPLYSYAGDKKPGDMNGNDLIVHMAGNYMETKDPFAHIPAGTGAGAMWWYAVVP